LPLRAFSLHVHIHINLYPLSACQQNATNGIIAYWGRGEKVRSSDIHVTNSAWVFRTKFGRSSVTVTVTVLQGVAV